MKKRLVKMLACILTVMCVLSYFAVPASAATSARFGNNSYCQVTISDKLINKRGRQYAKVKLKTYSLTGWWNSGGKVWVTLKDQNNNVIWSGVKRGGDTLKLGDDHKIYKIYISVYNEPVRGGIFRRSIINGNNFSNSGKCNTWTISNAKDCKIK